MEYPESTNGYQIRMSVRMSKTHILYYLIYGMLAQIRYAGLRTTAILFTLELSMKQII